MVSLQQATLQQLTALLNADEFSKISEFDVPKDDAIAPKFLLELAVNRLSQDPINHYWWSPRLIVADRRIVGMISFKEPPTLNGMVEIGYGIAPSQQKQGFATEAVKLLLEEAFSNAEIQVVIAHTDPSNQASQKVLKKNGFSREGSKIDPEDGEVWIWQKSRTIDKDDSVH